MNILEKIKLCYNKSYSDNTRRFLHGLYLSIDAGLELSESQLQSLDKTYKFLFKENIELPEKL